MRAAAAVALAAGPLVAPAPARADTPVDAPTAIDAERWVATATGWWAGLDDARTVGLGHLAVGATTSVIARPIALTSATGDSLGSPVAHRATVTAAAAYGVTRTVEVDVAVPLVIQDGDRLAALGDPEHLRRVTSGDVRLGGKIMVVDRAAFAVAIAAHVSLPSGNEGHYAGEQSWVLDWRGLIAAHLGRFSFGAGGGVRLRGKEVMLATNQIAGNEVSGAVAIGWAVPTVPGVYCDWTQLRVIAELDGVYGDKIGDARSPSPIEARVGVRGRIWRGWTLGVTGGRGLVDEVGAPRWRGVLDVSWRDEPRDDRPAPADEDEADECPDDDC